MKRVVWALSLCLASVAAHGKKRPILVLCYPGSTRSEQTACDKMVEFINNPKTCDNAEAVVAPSNASLGQIKEFVGKKTLPPNMLTVISGHALAKPDQPTTHFMSDDKDGIKTAELLELLAGKPTEGKVDSTKGLLKDPAFLLSACRAGRACSKQFCIFGTCQADQLTHNVPEQTFTDLATLEVLKRYCDKKEFDTFAKDGELGPAELKKGFACHPNAPVFEPASFDKPLQVHVARQLARRKLGRDAKIEEIEKLAKEMSAAVDKSLGSVTDWTVTNYDKAFTDVMEKYLSKEDAKDLVAGNGGTEFKDAYPGEAAIKKKLLALTQKRLFHAQLEDEYRKFIAKVDPKIVWKRPTDPQPDTFIRAWTHDVERWRNEDPVITRDLYAFFLAKGGLGDKPLHKDFSSNPNEATFGYPTEPTSLDEDAPGFKAIRDGVKLETKDNGNQFEVKMTYPKLSDKPTVCSAATGSFAFHPHMEHFRLKYYPDASYDPKPVVDEKAKGDAEQHKLPPSNEKPE